jgi:outer membrane protein assembly factor BamA
MLTRKTLRTVLPLLLCVCTHRLCAQIALAQSSLIYSTNEVGILADTTAIYNISAIVIEGNRHTKDKIILRELSFAEGEQYPLNALIQKFNSARLQLMNTTLFDGVIVSLENVQGNDAIVNVTVNERCYVFPTPFVKIIGQTFQEWCQKMDFEQVTYGIKLRHKNISGLNDQLDLKWSNGYAKELGVKYSGLSLDHDLKWSAGFSVSHGKVRDIAYCTENNQRLSYNDGNRFIYTYTEATASLTYRPAIKTKHTFGLGFTKQTFCDSLGKMNKNFTNQHNTVTYPEVFYNMQYQDLDFIPYPTKGYAANFLFQKKGFNSAVDLWQLTARTTAFWPLSPKSFINLQVTGTIKLPFDQPYMQQGFVGQNGMFLQGYEDYVIDGVAGGFTKASFNRNLLDHNFHIKSKKFKQLNDIPLKVYGKAFGNAGYVYNKTPGTNFLNNTALYSGGLGIDIVLFYDVIFRFEYSFNHLGGNGLYLHDKNNL